ncbi:hypothetical protein [Salinicoccus carnicancri]|uniref:hypothetical protein n=1 Tax=Salinicoccus carnicancri TaxID=558170 RepID=UPI00030A1F99|nr:hypothetical protein [Salinicoccus carnicancri]
MTNYNDLYNKAEKEVKKNYIFEKMTKEYSKDIFEEIVREIEKMNKSLIINGHKTELDINSSFCILKAKSLDNREFDRILKYEIYPPYERYKGQHKYIIDETITTELNGGLILRNNVWDVTKEYETHYLVSESKKDVMTVEEVMQSSYESFIRYII